MRKALSLDKPSYIPTPLHKPSSSQQYYHSSPEQLKHPEESLESKFTRQQHFKYHIPYYSSSFDYPSLSSSKTRPLIHPGYIQTYNFFSPIEEKGDFESETKGHPLMNRFNEDKDDICEKNEKVSNSFQLEGRKHICFIFFLDMSIIYNIRSIYIYI